MTANLVRRLHLRLPPHSVNAVMMISVCGFHRSGVFCCVAVVAAPFHPNEGAWHPARLRRAGFRSCRLVVEAVFASASVVIARSTSNELRAGPLRGIGFQSHPLGPVVMAMVARAAARVFVRGVPGGSAPLGDLLRDLLDFLG